VDGVRNRWRVGVGEWDLGVRERVDKYGGGGGVQWGGRREQSFLER